MSNSVDTKDKQIYPKEPDKKVDNTLKDEFEAFRRRIATMCNVRPSNFR
jgi:hypothetical protein